MRVKVTGSPPAGAPETLIVTVTVTVEVLAPSARMLDGLRLTATVFGTGVCVIEVMPLLPDWASVAVTVQTPGVIEAV